MGGVLNGSIVYCLFVFLFFVLLFKTSAAEYWKSSMILSQASRPALNSDVLFYRIGLVRAVLLLIGRPIQRFV